MVRTERKLGVTFPVSFRNKVRLQNGGSVEAQTDSWELYSFFDTSNKKRASRTCNDIVRETDVAKEWDLVPSDAIAIGSNGSGDQLVFLRKEDEPSKLVDAAYGWEHESGQLSRVAVILRNDLDRLRPPETMKKKRAKAPKKTDSSKRSEPPWLHDDPDAARTPYTEDELDKLVEGFIAGNGDSPAWTDLVRTHGFYGAREILRIMFIKKDPNLDNEPIN